MISVFEAAGDRHTTAAYSTVSAGRADGHLQGCASRTWADEHASGGDAYSRGEGPGRRRPCLGEVGSRAADSCAADAGEAGKNRRRGKGSRGDRLGELQPMTEFYLAVLIRYQNAGDSISTIINLSCTPCPLLGMGNWRCTSHC
jgi:hypothetical protein